MPPTSTWNVTSTPPLLPLLEWHVILNPVDQATKVFDLLKIGESITPSWLCVVDQLGPGFFPRCAKVVQGAAGIFFFLQGRGSLLIRLLRDSTGVRALRQPGYRYCCWREGVWLPAPPWRRGQGSNGEIGGKHTWYPLADWRGVTHADKQHGHAPKIKGTLLCVLSVIYANILTFDLNISLGKCDSQLWFFFFKSCITIFLLSNWSVKTSGVTSIYAKSPLNSG